MDDNKKSTTIWLRPKYHLRKTRLMITKTSWLNQMPMVMSLLKQPQKDALNRFGCNKGQMVDKGSSLAQIKPTGDIEYYLILWLPNNSIPYVKPGDVINIRYDAFPSDKFGQFPGKYFQYLRSRHPDRNCLNTLMLIMERTSRNWHSIKPLSN